MTFDSAQMTPGSVVTYLPTGGKQARRVLVESVETTATGSVIVMGVELTASHGLRCRRGVRPSELKAFWIWKNYAVQVSAATERSEETRKFVDYLRGKASEFERRLAAAKGL
jgi:hypothetical protein